MKYLNLSDNRLIKLPDELGILTNLIELPVMNNQLKELPSAFVD
ncbi:hypothetical protein [Psychrobacillus glaciei]|nr:hypothetical protein [Psychrobacillus glaciei]